MKYGMLIAEQREVEGRGIYVVSPLGLWVQFHAAEAVIRKMCGI
jgi:hypothetical protein